MPLFVGLISGTSADGIDAALVDISNRDLSLIESHNFPIDENTKNTLFALHQPGENELDRMGALDKHLGELFAEATHVLLKKAKVASREVCAIGSHGQTIRHRPPGIAETPAYTCQIGDPNIIAARTGITTVADFRRRDMALGGHGAPLVPGLHQWLFGHADKPRGIVNIGGIANISVLICLDSVLGYDVGPGNGLMDSWMLQHHGQHFDDKGNWAASGNCNHDLLNRMLEHRYFKLPPPKSTGREEFTIAWLNSLLEGIDLPAQDVQNTLCHLSCRSIVAAIKQHGIAPEDVYLCGGGIHNDYLCKLIANELKLERIGTTGDLGLHGDWVEACAFAWLAKQCIEKKPGNIPAVTGASKQAILGAVYFA